MEGDELKTDDVLHPVLEKLGSQYEPIRRLGGGEYSNVYLVRNKATGKELALKILDYYFLIQKLKKENIDNSKLRFDEIKKRFITEANLYKKIEHPNIVKIHEMGVVEEEKDSIEIPYFFMDYVKGSSLDAVIKKEAPLPIERVMEIAGNILSALEVIHKNNIVHRDLKPANIMIEAETGSAILIDFGIAKDSTVSKLTVTGAMLGTPVYMAPEQFMDSSNVAPVTDIYSFGMVIYEMLTGETPVKKGNNFFEIMNWHRKKTLPPITEKAPTLPEGLNMILSRAMAKDPNNRYKSAKEFMASLERVDQHSLTRKLFKLFILIAVPAIIISLLYFIDPFHFFHKPEPGSPISNGSLTPKDGSNSQNAASLDGKIKSDFNSVKEIISGTAAPKDKLKKCTDFLTLYKDVQGKEASLMIAEITELSRTLQSQLKTDDQHTLYIISAKSYLAKNEFAKALEEIEKAKKINDSEELKTLTKLLETQKATFEKVNGTALFETYKKEKITIEKYFEFKKKYPASVHLVDLKKVVIASDPLLPPEKYWDKGIRKNQRGYYEYTFDFDQNTHIMIYIPEKHFWIDKYEVSNAQVKKYYELEKMKPPAENSRFIKSGDEYPAVVSYEIAKRYCQRFGLRLPSNSEWEYVAGKGGKTYPWGDDAPDAGNMYRANYDSIDGSTEKDGFPGTAPVKSFERFSSPFGAFNMIGNVWEWIQDRQLKGGGFISPKEDLVITKTSQANDTDKEGFRCIREENEG